MLDIPHLSVDIHISYVAALAREDMLRERPFIERAIEEVGMGQGSALRRYDAARIGNAWIRLTIEQK